MKSIELHGARLVLSNSLDHKYADEFASVASDEIIARDIGAHGFPFPYTREDALEFFCKNRDDGQKPFAIDMLISVDGRIAGVIGLNDIEYYDRNAHIGYWIGRDFRNKGYATEAVSIISEFCREELALRKLYTRVLDYNMASLRVLIKNGFAVEGYQRDCILLDDGFHSMYVLGKVLG